MKLTKRRIRSFQNTIFDWWELNKRDLPWRHTRDPYKILISEVMLQQTQVSRVLPKYDEFLYFFPDVYSLAAASAAEVLRVWKGMGYNRRALYLKKTAEEIVGHYRGEFPDTETKLTQLPGLGTYTARAILVFAFQQDVAAVDTNIRQIIIHFFFHDLDQKPAVIQETADRLVPIGKSWEWHQALMDYGAIALPRTQNSMTRTQQRIPFKESKRYVRGKIINLLREKNMNEIEVQKIIQKPKQYVTEIISALMKDGLVVRKKEMLSLPD